MNTHHNQPYLQNLSTQSVHTLSDTIIVGRHQDCNLVLKAEKGASRKHARITVQNESVVLMDLGSLNGTLVNGREISRPVQLSDGDLVIFDEQEYRFTSSTNHFQSNSDNVTVIANKDEIGRPDRIKPAIRVVERAPAALSNDANVSANDETEAWDSLTNSLDIKDQQDDTGQRGYVESLAPVVDTPESQAQAEDVLTQNPQTQGPQTHDLQASSIQASPVSQEQESLAQQAEAPQAEAPQAEAPQQDSQAQELRIKEPQAQALPEQKSGAQTAQAQEAQAAEPAAKAPQLQAPRKDASQAWQAQESRTQEPQAQEPQTQEPQAQEARAKEPQSPRQQASQTEQVLDRDDLDWLAEEPRSNKRPSNEQQHAEHGQQDNGAQPAQSYVQQKQAQRSAQRPDPDDVKDQFTSFPATSRPGGDDRSTRPGLAKHYGLTPQPIKKINWTRWLIIVPLLAVVILGAIYLAYSAGFSAGNAGKPDGFS